MADGFDETDTRERHPIRSLLKLAIFAGLVYAAGKFVARKKEEYAGLNESQARDKLVEKMAPKVGDDTAAQIADQVIPKLRDRGLIMSDPIEVAVEEAGKAAEDVASAADKSVTEAADKVAEAVDSIVKD